jgi:uncharacterized protein (DUF697 family)/tellurite resistance protein
MARLDRTSLARLRLLVAVARADGHLQDEEVALIRQAFADHVEDVDEALVAELDIDAEVDALGDAAERKRTYEAAFAIAYADGRASNEEVNLLHRIYHDKGEDTLLEQVFGEARDTVLPSSILPVADPVQRKAEINEDIFKYSILAGVLGAMPLPGVAVINDVVVVGLQIKLIRDVGQYWGHKVDTKAARSLLAGAAGATGLRIALNNLMRFVPGWGSAFAAVTSFATTYAAGRVAEAYFASGARDFDPEAMRKLFEEARAEGRKAYTEHQAEVEALRETHGERIAALNERLAAGEITREDYEVAIEGLQE